MDVWLWNGSHFRIFHQSSSFAYALALFLPRAYLCKWLSDDVCLGSIYLSVSRVYIMYSAGICDNAKLSRLGFTNLSSLIHVCVADSGVPWPVLAHLEFIPTFMTVKLVPGGSCYP
jgi:hypothetical protein